MTTVLLMFLTYLACCPGLLGLFLVAMFLYALIPRRFSAQRVSIPLLLYPLIGLLCYGPQMGVSALPGLATTVGVMDLLLAALLMQSEVGLARQASTRKG